MAHCTEAIHFKTAVSILTPLVSIGQNANGVNMINDSEITQDISGSFVKLTQDMLGTCCHMDAGMHITRFAPHQQSLHEGLTDDEQIIMPYTQNHQFNYQISNSSFLPVIYSPGSMFLIDYDRESFDLFHILVNTWQLFVLMFVSCGLAGIIIWLLDKWINPDEFPHRFITGFWEGFWWAFVSMTTVGYGDLKPKSIMGRFFGMLWIITGIALFAVFTATLTAALGSENESRGTLQGRKIAVLNGTDEFSLALLMGATPYVFETLNDIYEALEADVIEDRMISGLLLDSIYGSQLNEIFKSEVLRIIETYSFPKIHGILFQNIDTELLECFHKYGRKMKYSMAKSMIDPGLHTNMKIKGADTIVSWLGINNVYLGIYAACVIATFIVLIIWEFVYWRPRHSIEIDAKVNSVGNHGSHQNGIAQQIVHNNCHQRKDSNTEKF